MCHFGPATRRLGIHLSVADASQQAAPTESMEVLEDECSCMSRKEEVDTSDKLVAK